MMSGNKKYDFISTSAYFILIPVVLHLVACNQQGNQVSQTQSKIDSLQSQVVDKAYKPGLGEFMTGIQLHHAKFWFVG